MKEIKHLVKSREKTKEDLINLYVRVVKAKDQYRYDLKKAMLDLLPDKKMLLIAFTTKKEYSLSQSVEDYGRLEFSEHRFINFLKFTEFSDEEVSTIFETHQQITSSIEPPLPYQYTDEELDLVRRAKTARVDFHARVKDEDLHDVPHVTPRGELRFSKEITEEEIERLYSDKED